MVLSNIQTRSAKISLKISCKGRQKLFSGGNVSYLCGSTTHTYLPENHGMLAERQ